MRVIIKSQFVLDLDGTFFYSDTCRNILIGTISTKFKDNKLQPTWFDIKSTHSFRFSLATSLKNAQTQIVTAMMLIRHKDQNNLARYEDPTTLEQGREVLLKIQNPLSDE